MWITTPGPPRGSGPQPSQCATTSSGRVSAISCRVPCTSSANVSSTRYLLEQPPVDFCIKLACLYYKDQWFQMRESNLFFTLLFIPEKYNFVWIFWCFNLLFQTLECAKQGSNKYHFLAVTHQGIKTKT